MNAMELLGSVSLLVVPFFCIIKEIPVAASTDMGRQEGDYVWKKNTENIQEAFDFMEELGS